MALLTQRLAILGLVVLAAAVASLNLGALLMDRWLSLTDLAIDAVPFPEFAASVAAGPAGLANSSVLLTIGSVQYCVDGECFVKGTAGYLSETTCNRSATGIAAMYITPFVCLVIAFVSALVDVIILVLRLTSVDPCDFAYTVPECDQAPGVVTVNDGTNPSAADTSPEPPERRAPLELIIDPIGVTQERRLTSIRTAKTAVSRGIVKRVMLLGLVAFPLDLVAVALIAVLETTYLTCSGGSECSYLVLRSANSGLDGAQCRWGSTFDMAVAASVSAALSLPAALWWIVAARHTIENDLNEVVDPNEVAPVTEDQNSLSVEMGGAPLFIKTNSRAALETAGPPQTLTMDSPRMP